MQVIMIMGAPASGKSTLANIKSIGCVHLNRDAVGGKVIDLLPKFASALRDGKDVVIDNVFATAISRKPFLDTAMKFGAYVVGKLMATSIEDAQINALQRMYRKYGRIYHTAAEMKGIDDPGVFPVAVLFKYRKDLQKPVISEGFDELETVRFLRQYPTGYVNKAVIFDYDGTLRESTGEHPYPTNTGEINIVPGRKEQIQRLVADGYLILGASNQSGIAKGILSDETARECFEATNSELGYAVKYAYCPHSVPPISCYCRKPGCAIGVGFIEKYRLDPSKCIVVGDQTTDKTFAGRLGMKFEFADRFKL